MTLQKTATNKTEKNPIGANSRKQLLFKIKDVSKHWGTSQKVNLPHVGLNSLKNRNSAHTA